MSGRLGNEKKERILIFIRGLPCSGKSTVSDYLSKNYHFQVIDPDHIGILRIIKYLLIDSSFNSFNLLSNIKLLKYRINLFDCIKHLNYSEPVVWCQMFRRIEGIVYTYNRIRQSVPDSGSCVLLNLSSCKECRYRRSKIFPKKFQNYISSVENSFEECPIILDDLKVFTIENNSNIQKLVHQVNKTISQFVNS